MGYDYCFRTDIGRKREKNQDFGGAFPELDCFVVADGMGGHRGGETASHVAVETVASYLQRNSELDPKKRIADALRAANFEVYRKSLEREELRGMGTTTTALLLDYDFESGTQAWIGHVGDSRCYFLLPGKIWQLTKDHSLVQEKLRAGIITREQVKTDRMKNVITRSIGFDPDVSVEVYHFVPPEGAAFLLCSDGLSGNLEDRVLSEVVDREFFERGSAEAAVDRLIDRANSLGGEDNITALLVHAHPVESRT